VISTDTQVRATVLPAFVTGTAAHPNVSINVADALMRAARNKLRERARSFLEGIIRR
jgi:hypothetical protein